MITEKDRICTCISKYGLSEKEATRIVKEDNTLLTIEELRMKFDNPNLGKKYPEWLTPIDHYKICCATVRQMYNGNFAKICTPEELASILFINSSIKLNTFKNHQHLKSGIVTMAMSVCRDNTRRQKYWSSKSLDDTFDENDELTNYERVTVKDTEREAKECLNAVMSIKNREVREILILTGYIVGGIDSFRPAFIDVIENSDLIIQEELSKLLKDISENDRVDRIRLEDKSCKFKKVKITLKSILKVFKTDLDIKAARLEIGEYLMSTGFMISHKI